MARLPQIGGDEGNWGQILNEYLEVAHNADGTVKAGSISGSSLQSNSVGVDKIATTGTPSNGQVLTYTGTNLAWNTPGGSGSVADASTTVKGVIQLSGDLAGTAAAPTVPGLATKESAVSVGTTAQYYRGDKSWQTLNKTAVGLANVDNTADANKPISTATQAALDAKASLLHVHSASDITSGTLDSARLPGANTSTIGAIQLSGDLAGTANSPTVPGLVTKEPLVAAGSTSQYYRGDKSWQTLNKTAVGLANVDNTADASKPISTATQTALDAKASTTHVHSGSDITTGTVAASRLPSSTSSATGVVQLATSAEAVTGTDTTKAVTPAGVKAAVSAVTYPVIFVNTLGDIPPGTPVDTLVVVRAA